MPEPTSDDHLVLTNAAGQYSLWAAHLDVPDGWRVALARTGRQECLDHVEKHWNDLRPAAPADDGPADPCLYALFAEQAARTPDAPALLWRDRPTGYRELADRAGEIARLLTERGVGPGDFVGLCVERSPLMVAALLGILRAGAAYVPLDPEYPVGRLRYVLSDTGATVLLTEEHLVGLFPDHDGQLLVLDAQDGAPPAAPAGPPPAARGHDVAYVIHTSGSTGRPKGVMVTHRSLANHSRAVNRTFRLGPGDRVLQCRSLSFDAAAEELFPPLLHGAALVLGDDPLRQTFRALTQQIIDTGTTFVSVPTAFWHSWVLEEDCLERLASESSLRLMIVAGEQARLQALSTWNKWVGPAVRWCNVYGPTEGTITSTIFEPGASWSDDDCASVPVGHPVDNVQAHVLDADLAPVPPGTVGELFLGGAGVAVGYLGRPATTAESFPADPFATEPGQRLYRTGDLVRATADGRIEFVGRRDHQVKVRGYRIELGEVETVACDHPAVRACVTLVEGTDAADTSLVAHVVPAASDPFPTADLLAHLRRELPWYMIPAAVVVVDAFPLTPNGKIDREALRSLDHEAAPQSGHLAPRTPVEAELAAIWRDVLNLESVSVDADFFQVGGHSLLAAGLISRMRSAFGVSVPARVLFEAPTIEGLAAAVTRLRAQAATGEA
ncbi:amino acid adenylation domain-containing protein [Streptantibioticus silvisoli]|uniref:Amino acid adenylation domain-containing protein n=1 Tax=Streptantibioticus silvisoli TaxID=2705255 RepID=A0ABT6W2N1_9ACTN|nr:amino acid adenylation domain-containing protein [Streptantibioticus silvisoli]MDI5965002.1 amino acid adenylation domain-containing protein [Streptantibioticus silvisoli]